MPALRLLACLLGQRRLLMEGAEGCRITRSAAAAQALGGRQAGPRLAHLEAGWWMAGCLVGWLGVQVEGATAEDRPRRQRQQQQEGPGRRRQVRRQQQEERRRLVGERRRRRKRPSLPPAREEDGTEPGRHSGGGAAALAGWLAARHLTDK